MAVDAEDSQDLDVQDFRLWWEQGQPQTATEGRSRVWKLAATIFVIVGIASVGALALRGDGSKPPKGAPAATADNGGETGQQTSGGETAAASNEVAPVLSSPGSIVAPPPAPDIKPVRTVTLRPDGAPVGTPVPMDSSAPRDAPRPPPVPEPAATKDASRIERPVKSDSPTPYPPERPPPRAAVARRDATDPAVAEETGAKAFLPPAPIKADGAANEPGPPQAAPDTIPASFNRMLNTIGALFGAGSPPARQPEVFPASAGWAVQLAAPRSEAEARTALARLSARHASTLKGSRIGVRKAVVDGVTVYRLRVVDLSRADASVLCARLKGDGGDCFVAR